MKKDLKSFDDIYDSCRKIAKRTVPQLNFALFDREMEFGCPYIAIECCKYHYLAKERGVEVMRKTTESLDDLLYWIFSDITFDAAVAYELDHRSQGRDSRRVIFSRQLQLMTELSLDWAKRIEKEIGLVLEGNPYTDGVMEE